MGIENYFESDEFFDSLSPIAKYFETNYSDGKDLMGYFISEAIKYSALFSKDEKLTTIGLSDFIKKIVTKISSMDMNSGKSIPSNSELKEYVNNLLADELLLKLGLTKEQLNDENCKKSVYAYIVRAFDGKRYKYHAFNSVFFDSILANGINPNVNFTPPNEMNLINDIFEKRGIRMILGWWKLNCEGKVSYSTTPDVSYSYGTRSPEWFSFLAAGGSQYGESDKYNVNAYEQRNYDSAKNNLLTVMKEKNFAPNVQKFVIDFFDKNWNIYVNGNPMLAVIPDSKVKESALEDLTNWFFNDPNYKDIESLINFYLNYQAIDAKSTEKIDVSNAIFIKMPRYDEALRRLASKKTEAIQNESGKKQEELLHEKLMILANIQAEVNITGKDGLLSEQELLKVKELLKDNDVYQAIVKNQFGEELYLDNWISAFDKEIINNPENVKLLAFNKPSYFGCVSEENRNNIELMRKCACQKGIQPILFRYVGKDVKNDIKFLNDFTMNLEKKVSKQPSQSSPEKELNLTKMSTEDENLETNVEATHRPVKK